MPRRSLVVVTASVLVLTTAEAAADAPTSTRPSLKQLVGQHLVVRIGGTTPSRDLIARVERGEIGGVVVFGDDIPTPAHLARSLSMLQRAARRGSQLPLLTVIDQEGGRVKRLRGAPPRSSPAALGANGSAAEARREGRRTGSHLRALGLNVNLAPVLDVPTSPASFLGDRAYGRSPAVVAEIGAAFATGLQDRRVGATAKHFPGLGSARSNTDRVRVSVTATRAQLLRQLVPFRAAIARDVKLVMVSNASYPALDSTGVPALFSRRIVTDLLRRRLGFEGVVITDSMQAPGPSSRLAGPVLALEAGVDLLLHTGSDRSSADLFRQVLRAARSGDLSRAELERSYARIEVLRRWLAAPR